MENQKPNDASAWDLSHDGAGSSMGKDMSSDAGRTGGNTGNIGNTGNTGNTGSTGASTAGSVIDKAKDMARDLSKDVPASASASDMHKTIDKAADAAQPIVDRLATSAHAGVDKLSSALSGVGGSMDERTRQLSDAARTFTDTGREYVRNSPGTSVLAAVGVGYLLAKFLGNRR